MHGPFDSPRFDAIGRSGVNLDGDGFHTLPLEVQTRIWQFWLCFDGRLSLARVGRRAVVEDALMPYPILLAEFRGVLATEAAQRDLALMLDFSSSQSTYLDRPLPSIEEQLMAVEIKKNICIVAFNIHACHPKSLLAFAEALLRHPELVDRVAAVSTSVQIPSDKINRIHGRTSIITPPSRPIKVL
jgi:hypothetical protein